MKTAAPKLVWSKLAWLGCGREGGGVTCSASLPDGRFVMLTADFRTEARELRRNGDRTYDHRLLVYSQPSAPGKVTLDRDVFRFRSSLGETAQAAAEKLLQESPR